MEGRKLYAMTTTPDIASRWRGYCRMPTLVFTLNALLAQRVASQWRFDYASLGRGLESLKPTLPQCNQNRQ
jgi:hypothetical protein